MAVIDAKCNKCNNIYIDYGISRNHRGDLSLEGAICQNCGGKNCMSRIYTTDDLSPLLPPAEDGNLNRFEVSYTNEDGKRIVKKHDPKMVEKHFQATNKGQMNKGMGK